MMMMMTKMMKLMTEDEEVYLLFTLKPHKSNFILKIKLQPKLGGCQVTTYKTHQGNESN